MLKSCFLVTTAQCSSFWRPPVHCWSRSQCRWKRCQTS